ncbi:MAG: electron transfer flavoprotein subunit alpha [Planctomycetes bacterium]|nr:electron transfer flavoprotein subunit alpha [Planctomycetota bacterium]
MAASLIRPEEAQRIWVWLEHDGTSLEGVSLELLAKGRELADRSGEGLVGLLMGHELDSLADEALGYGADEIVVAEDPLLEVYTTDAWCDAAAQVVLEKKPNILLFGATPDGRDLAGRLAVRLRTGLTADCTDLEIKTDEPALMLAAEVTGFGGGVAAIIACKENRPQMATVRPGVFRPALRRSHGEEGVQSRCPVRIDPGRVRTRVLERRIGEAVDITKAEALVVGGRGVKGDFGLLETLAGLLGAELGASRVAVDEGWIEKDRMIGQTGSVTRPKVAIVCGVSGAMQFTVGIMEADTVVAINSDPEAPIFESADYCVVDDLFSILPPLIRELENSR